MLTCLDKLKRLIVTLEKPLRYWEMSRQLSEEQVKMKISLEPKALTDELQALATFAC